MEERNYNNDSLNPADWSTDKQWAEAMKDQGKPRPGIVPGIPTWAGAGTVAFFALLGFIGGMVFGQGSWAMGAVGAVALGGANLLFRIAFKSSGGGGNHAVQYAAIGFIGGFVLAILVAFVGIKARPFDVAIIAAVVGGVAGFLHKR